MIYVSVKPKRWEMIDGNQAHVEPVLAHLAAEEERSIGIMRVLSQYTGTGVIDSLHGAIDVPTHHQCPHFLSEL
jgi:GH25 family lysozyme M1 (1,4-beta-N-acetylmuramidase)